MSAPRLNPRRINNNFRLQPLIEEEMALAKEVAKGDLKTLSNAELVDLALVYLEIGDWKTVYLYATMAQKLEEGKSAKFQNKEIIATIYYILATRNRELNDCKTALTEYDKALSLTKSNWLISNIYRNAGLAYLKQKDFRSAAEKFKKGFNQVTLDTQSDLRGSMPALFNYYGLALTREALQSKKDPNLGLQLLEETTQLYQSGFAENRISPTLQLKSHDWQSHQYHRGMVLCEMAELQSKDSNKAARENLQKAEELLLGSLAGRKANQADDQRLGDVNVWLGRVYVGLNQVDNARKYFGDALKHFRLAFPNSNPNEESAPQIQDVLVRLSALPQLGAASIQQSTFTVASTLPTPVVTVSNSKTVSKSLN